MKLYYEGEVIYDLQVENTSSRTRKIMGEHSLTFNFLYDEFIEIPIGAYTDFQGQIYTLKSPENFKKYGAESFEYTLVMHPPQADAEMYKFRNTDDGRLKFSLTAQPQEHLEMFVKNMNARDPEKGWSVANCIEGTERCISYNHTYCLEALQLMADEFETEWEINDKEVSLRKVEYNKSEEDALKLSYGKGNGLVPGVGRENYGKGQRVEVLYVEGTDRNIDYSQYPKGNYKDGTPRRKSKELLLPFNQKIAYDGEKFYYRSSSIPEGVKVRWYEVDDYGVSVRREGTDIRNGFEDSIDLSHIYPSQIGYVTDFYEDPKTGFYDIFDNKNTIDYNKFIIEGEDLEITFQSGMLTGKTFKVSYKHAEKRFMIVQQAIDGYNMPCSEGGFEPRKAEGDYPGDSYMVFGCMLPDDYICHNLRRTGASWDMLREAVKALYELEEQPYTFIGEINPVWAKKDWLNRGGKIKLGGYVSLSDTDFSPEGPILIRQVAIVDYYHNPHAPVIELSNDRVGRGNVLSDLAKIEQNEVVIEDKKREVIGFTKRRFKSAMETITMLEESMLNNFSESINPMAVYAMSMLAGDESLQYKFVKSLTNSSIDIDFDIDYNAENKFLRTTKPTVLRHLTLGIGKDISSDHNYMQWSVKQLETGYLGDDADKGFYLYVRASKTDQSAEFFLSPDPIKMDEEEGYYHFLVGILNSELNGHRDFVTLYGFSEILPGRITTDRLISSDGKTYFDLDKNLIAINNDNGTPTIKFDGNDGSGHVARGNLSWDAKGKIIGVGAEFDNIKVQNSIFTNVSVVGSQRNPFRLWSSAVNVFDGDGTGLGKYDNVVMPITSSSLQERILTPEQFTWGAENSGRVIRIVNYKWSTGIAQGSVILKAPEGKAFFENGERYSQLKLSRDCIELLGYGTSSQFYGWIVLNRAYVHTVGQYGSHQRVLYAGIYSPSSKNVLERLYSADMESSGLAEEWWMQYGNNGAICRIYLPKHIQGEENWHVMVSPTLFGATSKISSDAAQVYACVVERGVAHPEQGASARSYFDVRIADDDSINPGGFVFQVLGTYDWREYTQGQVQTRTGDGNTVVVKTIPA